MAAAGGGMGMGAPAGGGTGGGARPAGAGGGSGGAGGGTGGGMGRGGGTVELAKADSRMILNSLQTVGTAESPFRVEIAPKTTGRIEFLLAREGDQVRKGDVLVRIDPSELQAQVLQQQAQVAQAQSRLAEAQLGQGSATVSASSQIQQQRAGLTGAQAEFNQVRKNYAAQVATAQSAVDEATSRVNSAESSVKNAQSEVQRQQANLKNAKTKLARIENLYRQGFIAAQDVDDARTEVDVQQAAVNSAQQSVVSAQSAVALAEAQKRGAQQQLSIAKQKGQADVIAARARVTQAQAGVQVANANRTQGPAYKQNLAALQANVQAARAQLSQAQARLSDTVLRSPIDGTVTARSADPGALAAPGSPVLVVQSLDWLYVTASLPIENSSVVTNNQVVQIEFDALPGQKFTGQVSNINPAADVKTRQFGMRVKLPNPGHKIKPGMFGRLSIVTGRVNADVAVPREAVKIMPDGKSTVTVVDKDLTAHVVEVKVGASDDKGVQILEGVKPGDRVVTLTFTPIREGQKVKLPGQGGGPGQGGQRTGGGQGRGQGTSGGQGRGARGS
jgi:HlyD family secretion protein